MPIGVSVWRIQQGKAIPVERAPLANEKLLEDILEADIALLGLPKALMVLGRQVQTDFAGRVDLLCIHQEGKRLLGARSDISGRARHMVSQSRSRRFR